MKHLDRDFTFEEFSQIVLKRPNYKSKGDDNIYYEYIKALKEVWNFILLMVNE